MLRLIGLDELVAQDADDYVAIAARLAADDVARAALRQRIAQAAGRLFDDRAPVERLQQALEALARGTDDHG